MRLSLATAARWSGEVPPVTARGLFSRAGPGSLRQNDLRCTTECTFLGPPQTCCVQLLRADPGPHSDADISCVAGKIRTCRRCL